MIVTASATKLGLDEDTCVKILDESGFLATSGIAKVDLLHVPSGLSASETKRYLLENGTEIWAAPSSEPRWIDLCMKAIINRLRRLETATAPHERERAAAEAIIEARRRRLGADYEPMVFPEDWFAGCRGTADQILRARHFLQERKAAGQTGAK
jgi:hypothetical protein